MGAGRRVIVLAGLLAAVVVVVVSVVFDSERRGRVGRGVEDDSSEVYHYALIREVGCGDTVNA